MRADGERLVDVSVCARTSIFRRLSGPIAQSVLTMIDVSVLETEFHAAQEAVTRQGDVVRSLKAAVKDGKAEKVSTPHATCSTS